jgi:hypothetical protein
VLGGGVDVAADVQAGLGDVVAGEPAGDLLLGLQRPDAALADVVGRPDRGVASEPEHVVLPVAAELEQVSAGVLGGGVLRPGDAGHVGKAGQDRVPELGDQRAGDARRDLGLAALAGGVPGLDEAAQRPLGLAGPQPLPQLGDHRGASWTPCRWHRGPGTTDELFPRTTRTDTVLSVSAADGDGPPVEKSLNRDRQAGPAAWNGRMSSMGSEVDKLRNGGRWLGGKHTLMHALGIHYLELPLTAGLAWLLDPDGWHGLGSHVLSGLLGELGLPPVVGCPVTVTTEEARPAWQTRADLVVRMPGTTLLFEVKVLSGEADQQCDRLSKAWEAEVPTRVFLTLDGRPPVTAVHSRGQWINLIWTQVGVIIRGAMDSGPDCAPGAREFLATIEMLGATQLMTGDDKAGFYLRHWQEIQEWALLRTQSLDQFEAAFVRAAEVKRGMPGGPHVEESDSAQWHWYGLELALPAIAPARAFVAFGWTHSQLFGPTGDTLPYVGIKLDVTDPPVFATVKELLRDAAQACHWPTSAGSWVWYTYLPFGASDTDLDAYAEKQMNGLVAAHTHVQSSLPPS